jgi:putative flippase GtrA
LKRLFFEAAKFGAVGGVAFLVDNGAYFLLVNGPGQVMAGFPVRASVVASAVATVVSYLGNRYWTFSKRRDRGPSDGTRGTPVREFVAYVIANVIGIMITGGCLYFSRWMLDFHTAAADAVARNVGIALGTVFRYLAYKFWVFTGPPKETP